MFLKVISNHLLRRQLRGFKSVQICYYSEQNCEENHYDIAVVGGGLIGSTLACTLGKNKNLADKRVLLLEHTPEKKYEVGKEYSVRVSALSPGTCQLLRDIDVWDHIAGVRFGTVKHMQILDGLSDVTLTFDNEKNNGTIANIVENDLILHGVYKELSKLNNVNVVYNSRIDKFDVKTFPQTTNIKMKDGKQFTCNLLLGCDGFNSQVRREMGVHYISKNYNHSGIVATLNIKQDCEENTVAWQKFLTEEVIALLPLNAEYSSLVWCMPTEAAKTIMSKSDEEFLQLLEGQLHKTFKLSPVVETITKSFDNLIKSWNCPSRNSRQITPKITGCRQGSRAAFPLGLGHATNYIGPGFALVGDAAHRVHPLAGQGVNLGFGDIVCLNNVLSETVINGAVLGDMNYLKRYEQERQFYNTSMMLTVHGLFTLYSTENIPVVLARSLGIQATHALKPLKNLLVSQASG